MSDAVARARLGLAGLKVPRTFSPSQRRALRAIEAHDKLQCLDCHHERGYHGLNARRVYSCSITVGRNRRKKYDDEIRCGCQGRFPDGMRGYLNLEKS